jgi:hypothetical protein
MVTDNLFLDIYSDLDWYYIFGNYLYNLIQPDISGDIDMFKYILGKFYLDYLLN